MQPDLAARLLALVAATPWLMAALRGVGVKARSYLVEFLLFLVGCFGLWS